MDDVSFKGMRGREYRALTIARKENTERHFAAHRDMFSMYAHDET
jgi:hypothetical protein